MLKKILLIFFAGSLTTALISFTPPKPVLRTIIVDAGHGGVDQGAPGLESTEAKIALEISR